jgi:MYXO-CTERM domain-containing protein
VKIIDGVVDTPAVTLESIDGMSYAGQGWRLAGCVDTPAGSTVSGWYRVDKEGEVESEASWLPWVKDKPIATGKLDLCFAPEQAGLLHVRVAVKGPDGKQSFAYAPDSLVRVDTMMKCLPGDAHCCDPAPVGMTGALQPSAAGSAAAPMMNAGMGMAGAVANVAGAGGAAVMPPPMMTVQPVAPASSNGCSVANRETSKPTWLVIAALLAAAVTRRRRRQCGQSAALTSERAPSK